MRAPGDHNTNDSRVRRAARTVTLSPLRHTASEDAASRPGDSTSASQTGPSRGAKPPQPNPGPSPRQPKLLDRMREALRSRHYSPRTEQTYCHWVKRFRPPPGGDG
jgi:Phage integrase, N-terminal SAM-like domain